MMLRIRVTDRKYSINCRFSVLSNLLGVPLGGSSKSNAIVLFSKYDTVFLNKEGKDISFEIVFPFELHYLGDVDRNQIMQKLKSVLVHKRVKLRQDSSWH